MAIKRFGVSLEEEVLGQLDELVKKHQFPNRSQAIRYLIKEHQIEDQWKENEAVAGTITLLFDHHKRNLSNQSTSIQHEYHQQVLSVQHIHLNHDNCLETIAVKGKASELIDLADKLIGMKGIKHGKLVMTSVG
ncbi:MAG: nickel-responsive transcriptional regulator NikR [Bacteroidales bacterium]|nr:nickel-responsive transcriptional regulator NikR [Bacteroidales bacterium]MBS3774227.1 nickel-responsive transcriptional regulator NikR [Bacteroidales bacterium]